MVTNKSWYGKEGDTFVQTFQGDSRQKLHDLREQRRSFDRNIHHFQRLKSAQNIERKSFSFFKSNNIDTQSVGSNQSGNIQWLSQAPDIEKVAR
jgi:hypothetical protein